MNYYSMLVFRRVRLGFRLEWFFDVASPVDGVVFMRKVIGVFADVSLQMLPASLAIGHKDFVSYGVAVEVSVVADFIQNFVRFKGIAGFRIFDFRFGAFGFVGFIHLGRGSSIDAGAGCVAVGGLIIKEPRLFVIFAMAAKPFVYFCRQGYL